MSMARTRRRPASTFALLALGIVLLAAIANAVLANAPNDDTPLM